LREKAEPGIPGVRIFLEDGSFSITDADGRYSFADLRPRTHVAKVDRATLPRDTELAILANRNSGDAGSRFVDLHDGELAKADFAVQTCTPALTEAIAARRSAIKEAERKAAAVLAAPAAAPKAAAVAMDTLDNTLGFVDLADHAVLPGAVTTVRVKGGAGATITVTVNGEAVSDKRIGQRASASRCVPARTCWKWPRSTASATRAAAAPSRSRPPASWRRSASNWINRPLPPTARRWPRCACNWKTRTVCRWPSAPR
jgi:hypothetical protein